MVLEEAGGGSIYRRAERGVRAPPVDTCPQRPATSSVSVREIASAATLVINLEQIAPSESGGIDPAIEAALSVAIEPDTDFNPYESRVADPLDSSSVMDSEPLVSAPVESDWAPIMEFTSAQISFSTHLSEMC